MRAAGGKRQPGGSLLLSKTSRYSSDGEKYSLEPAASWEPGGRGRTPALAALRVQFPSPSLFSLIAQRGLPGTACFLPRAGTKLCGMGLGRADPGTGNTTLEEGSNRFGLRRGAMLGHSASRGRDGNSLFECFAPGQGVSAAPRGALPIGMGHPHPSYPGWGHPRVPWGGWRCRGSTANSQSRVPAGVSADLMLFFKPLGRDISFSRWAWVRVLCNLLLQPFPCLRLGCFMYERAQGGKVELQHYRQSLNIIFPA